MGPASDRLKVDVFRRYVTRPESLREELEAEPPSLRQQIVIDEIQKVPALLDEVHWLIENRGLHFVLCGSSARKVRPSAANLLGGRATRYELHGLTAAELGRDFDLGRIRSHGYLPRNWVFHELSAFVSYHDFEGDLTYWRLASGIEVDFVLGDMQLAIEAKSSERITRDHLKGLCSLVEDHPRVGRRVVVSRQARARKTDDCIEILPAATFVKRLWAGDLTS